MCFLETGSGKWLLKSCLLWALLLPGTAESLYSWVVIQVDALLAEEAGEEGLNASDGKQSPPLTEVEAWTNVSPWTGPSLQFFCGVNVHATTEI